ncbi:hypothetical protein LIER_42638 [Lithospermum erythrorhizon]|uniref:Uncharacterized protein n=1 Tax=Lithospermum erythrorhizon TaxID=34254 RepID=A0AAV3NTB9_LITER
MSSSSRTIITKNTKVYKRITPCLLIPFPNNKKSKTIIKFIVRAIINLVPEVTYRAYWNQALKNLLEGMHLKFVKNCIQNTQCQFQSRGDGSKEGSGCGIQGSGYQGGGEGKGGKVTGIGGEAGGEAKNESYGLTTSSSPSTVQARGYFDLPKILFAKPGEFI